MSHSEPAARPGRRRGRTHRRVTARSRRRRGRAQGHARTTAREGPAAVHQRLPRQPRSRRRGSSGTVTELQPDGTTQVGRRSGGVQYLATHLRAGARRATPDSLTVAAGDLIGASPLLSGAFHDEPTIEAMNALGLRRHERRQPRVRRGLAPSCCGCRTAAAAPIRTARTAADSCPAGPARSPGRTSRSCPPTSCATDTGTDAVPAVRRQGSRRREDRLHRHDAQGHAGHRHRGRRAGPDVPRRGDDGQQVRRGCCRSRA